VNRRDGGGPRSGRRGNSSGLLTIGGVNPVLVRLGAIGGGAIDLDAIRTGAIRIAHVDLGPLCVAHLGVRSVAVTHLGTRRPAGPVGLPHIGLTRTGILDVVGSLGPTSRLHQDREQGPVVHERLT
jgi:hypothetical protein